MLSDTMASNGAVCSTPHAFAHTSISSGGSTLLSPANLIQPAVLARESASGSLGNHVRLGIAPAKCTACSPVPQPISARCHVGEEPVLGLQGSVPSFAQRQARTCVGPRLRRAA